MQRLLTITVVLVTTLVLTMACNKTPDKAATPAAGNTATAPVAAKTDGATAAKLKNADGTTFTIADIKGKVKVVNFWATWCAPCIAEMPTLNALSAKYADKDVSFVAVSLDDEGPEAAEPRLKAGKPKIDFRVAYALIQDVAPLDVEFPIPDTLVFDSSNRLVKHFDKVVESAELEAAINEALAGSTK